MSDVIVTREARDAKPLPCDRTSEAGWFEGSSRYKEDYSYSTWAFESAENWFFFN